MYTYFNNESLAWYLYSEFDVVLGVFDTEEQAEVALARLAVGGR